MGLGAGITTLTPTELDIVRCRGTINVDVAICARERAREGLDSAIGDQATFCAGWSGTGEAHTDVPTGEVMDFKKKPRLAKACDLFPSLGRHATSTVEFLAVEIECCIHCFTFV